MDGVSLVLTLIERRICESFERRRRAPTCAVARANPINWFNELRNSIPWTA